jgi:hypothetical protein
MQTNENQPTPKEDEMMKVLHEAQDGPKDEHAKLVHLDDLPLVQQFI